MGLQNGQLLQAWWNAHLEHDQENEARLYRLVQESRQLCSHTGRVLHAVAPVDVPAGPKGTRFLICALCTSILHAR